MTIHCHARMPLSGIQTGEPLDSRHALSPKRGRARRKHAGMTEHELGCLTC